MPQQNELVQQTPKPEKTKKAKDMFKWKNGDYMTSQKKKMGINFSKI